MAGITLEWERPDKYHIKSGQYRIAFFRLGKQVVYEVYHGEELIGDAPDGNKARKIAQQHSERSMA